MKKLAIAISIMAVSMAAEANLIVNGYTFSPPQTINIPDIPEYPLGVRGGTTTAGQYEATFDGTDIKIFCAELDQWVRFGLSYHGYVFEDAPDSLDTIGSYILEHGISNARESAEIQEAIWKLIYEGVPFPYSGPITATAKYITNSQYQNMVTFIPITEPGILALLGIGLIGIYLRNRWNEDIS